MIYAILLFYCFSVFSKIKNNVRFLFLCPDLLCLISLHSHVKMKNDGNVDAIAVHVKRGNEKEEQETSKEIFRGLQSVS